MASYEPKSRPKGDRIFKKIENKKHIWPQVEPKLRPKGDRIKKMKINSTYGLGWSQNRSKRSGSMASGAFEPRQKRALWLWFLSEAKSYPLLASPQYASVREPVQNIKNNRCQSSFLHWWLVTIPKPLLFLSCCMIREKTLLMLGRGSMSKIWVLTLL